VETTSPDEKKQKQKRRIREVLATVVCSNTMPKEKQSNILKLRKVY
jgi:hypothetical protein